MNETATPKIGRGHGSKTGVGRIADLHPEFQRTRRRVENYVANIVDDVIESGIELPLTFLLRVMNDSSKDLLVRIECARAAMPYVHRKKPVAVESTSNNLKLTMEITQKQLENLTDDQLESLTALAQKLTPPGPAGAGEEETSFVEAEEVLPRHGASPEGALPEAPGVLPSGGDSP